MITEGQVLPVLHKNIWCGYAEAILMRTHTICFYGYLVWFEFCFTALQHILGHFGHGQST